MTGTSSPHKLSLSLSSVGKSSVPTTRVWRSDSFRQRLDARLLSIHRRVDASIVLLATLLIALAPMPRAATSWRALSGFEISVSVLAAIALAFVCWCWTARMFGLYHSRPHGSRRRDFIGVLTASVAAGVLLLPLGYLDAELDVSGTRVVVFIAGVVAATMMTRPVVRALSVSPDLDDEPRRVLIVGSGPRAYHTYIRLLSSAPRPIVVGFVDTNPAIRHEEIRSRLLGDLDVLESVLMEQVVDEVLIALPIKSCYERIQRAITTCAEAGVQSRYFADVFECAHARPRFEHEGSIAHITMAVAAEDGRLIVKRAIDVLGATIGLLLLSPVLLGVAVAVRVTSPGPVIFQQERFGFHKRRFRMWKFRTMVQDAEAQQSQLESLNEASGPAFKIRNDPRLTSIGGFLRRTSLDELPQLVNVLRGDMSLVGPRPMAVRDVSLFDEAWLMRRFSVRPGITCIWQVSGRSGLSFADWIALDLQYIDDWSLTLDVKILLQTVPAVLRRTGAA